MRCPTWHIQYADDRVNGFAHEAGDLADVSAGLRCAHEMPTTEAALDAARGGVPSVYCALLIESVPIAGNGATIVSADRVSPRPPRPTFLLSSPPSGQRFRGRRGVSPTRASANGVSHRPPSSASFDLLRSSSITPPRSRSDASALMALAFKVLPPMRSDAGGGAREVVSAWSTPAIEASARSQKLSPSSRSGTHAELCTPPSVAGGTHCPR